MARGRAHGLDLVRLGAAFAVIISHAWPLTGAPEPLEVVLGTSLGGLAVLLFFFVSGLLIAESATRSRAHKKKFIAARAARIFPGLLGALCATLAIAALCGSEAYWREQLVYVIRGLSLVSLEHQLTGAFAQNPMPFAVNGPLWSLFYEALLYSVLAALLWSQVSTPRWTLPFFASGSAILCIVAGVGLLPGGAIGYRLEILAPLAYAFALGALVWQGRERIMLNGMGAMVVLILSLAIAVALRDATVTVLLLAPALSYAALVVGYSPSAVRLPGDISYGVYIYGWPVAQAILHVAGPMSAQSLALASALAVLPFAIASWALVERPAISKHRLIFPAPEASTHAA